MRKLALALVLALAAPAAADPAPAVPPTTPGNPNNASNPEGAPPPEEWEMRDDQRAHRGQCIKLTKQIARYERDAGWARERDNELWELSSRERVYRLAAKRQRLCPSKESPSVEELLAEAALVAAKLAAAAYTQGAL